jgi:hypothetical protein
MFIRTTIDGAAKTNRVINRNIWCRPCGSGTDESQSADNEHTARFRLAGGLSGLSGTHRSVAAATPHTQVDFRLVHRVDHADLRSPGMSSLAILRMEYRTKTCLPPSKVRARHSERRSPVTLRS